MGTKTKQINNNEYEVLEHSEKPGFKRVFHVVITLAVLYLIYIFSHSF